MTSSPSSANSIQSWYNLDELKFKNRKCMKYRKRVAIKILKIKASKKGYFIDAMINNVKYLHWLVHMNAIKLTMRGERGVNDANDVHRIVDEVRKLKDDLHRVWIKNHNMKATLTSVKLFVITNLVCAIFMFVTTMLFLLNK